MNQQEFQNEILDNSPKMSPKSQLLKSILNARKKVVTTQTDKIHRKNYAKKKTSKIQQVHVRDVAVSDAIDRGTTHVKDFCNKVVLQHLRFVISS